MKRLCSPACVSLRFPGTNSTSGTAVLIAAVAAALVFACSDKKSPPATAEKPTEVQTGPDKTGAVSFMGHVSSFARRLPDSGLVAGLEPFVVDSACVRAMSAMKADELRSFLSMKIDSVDSRAGRFVLNGRTSSDGTPARAIVYFRDGVYRLDLALSISSSAPGPADPHPGNIDVSFDDAVAGITGEGPLMARFDFSNDASITCRLYEKSAPDTVAAFVSLARGLRFVRSESDQRPDVAEGTDSDVQIADAGDADAGDADAGRWSRRPWYDGFSVSVTDDKGMTVIAAGSNPGFRVRDEFEMTPGHDRPGLLTTVPDGPDAWSGTIGITSGRVSSHDYVGTIFGECESEKAVRLPKQIRESTARGARPVVRGIVFTRAQ